MSSPITWRTIQQPTGASEAAGLMAGAQRSIAGGFDAFNDIIKKQEATAASNVGVESEIQKQDFMDLLSQARTPEELAALQPQIEMARSALNVANRASTRGAEDVRSAALMQQTTARNNFDDAILARTRAPLIAQANEFIAKNDQAGLKAFLDANDLGDESVFLNKAYDTSRVRKTNAYADALAPGANEAALAAQRLQQQLRPQLESNARGAAVLTGRTQTEQGRVLDTAAEDRLIDQLTFETAQARSVALQADKMKLGGLATKLGLPVDSSGAPQISAMKESDLQRLDAEAAKQGLIPSSQLYTGDTQSANQFFSALGLDSRISPTALARRKGSIMTAFDTSGQNTQVGNDAALTKLKEAVAQVDQKERDAGNWYAPGSATAMTSYEELRDHVSKSFPEDIKEDIPDMQTLMYKLATEGLDLGNGKKLMPSKKDILAAIDSTMGDYNLLNKSRSKDVEAFLKKTLNTSRVTELTQQAEASKKANRTLAVRELLNAPAPAKK